MIIATAMNSNGALDHFGHCEHFLLHTIEDGKVVASKKFVNPEHKHGVLPGLLRDLGVETVLVESIGPSAMRLLDELGIRYLKGLSMTANSAIEGYLAGTLVSSDDHCDHHDHQHQHNHHHS
ncbi:MAG: NifB/NifX family molybdenum-iron cluster-binding protein [Bacillus subtilis]|nr:NifB/NifX family molybdenum-iron cluster-binding protein [Bacillus subtilis]